MKKMIFLLLLMATLHLQVQAAKSPQTALIVCENSLEMFAHDLEFIRHANESIEISSPFAGGKIFRELLQTIKVRMDEKKALQVHILTAPIFFEDQDGEMLQQLKELYPDRFHVVDCMGVPVRKPDLIAIENHTKIFIVDETYFVIGGTNLDEGLCTDGSYKPNTRKAKDYMGMVKLPSGARDGDVVGRGGPLAKEIRTAFFSLYAIWEDYQKTKILKSDPAAFKGKTRYFPVKSHTYVPYFEHSKKLIMVDKIKFIFSGPWEEKNSCTEEYKRLLDGAQKSVTVGNLYFSPADKLMAAFKSLVNRNVELVLLGNGIHNGVTPEQNTKYCWAHRIHYVPLFYGREFAFWESYLASTLLTTNCRIFEYYVDDIVYHKKAMVVDGKILVIGSYNLGKKSDLADYEVLLVIESEAAAQEELNIFQKELRLSVEITPEQARTWYFDPVIVLLAGAEKIVHGIL